MLLFVHICVASKLSWWEQYTGISKIMGSNPLNFSSAQMRQSLTLSSKCKDLFFNSPPNHSSETFLALTSWNQDESLCQRQVCWFLEAIAPTTLLRWSLSDLDCINLSSFVRCSKLLHQGRDVAVLFHQSLHFLFNLKQSDDTDAKEANDIMTLIYLKLNDPAWHEKTS